MNLRIFQYSWTHNGKLKKDIIFTRGMNLIPSIPFWHFMFLAINPLNIDYEENHGSTCFS